MGDHKNLWRLFVRVSVNEEEAARGEMFAVTGAYPATHARPDAKTVRVECFFDSLTRARDARRQLAHFKPRIHSLPYEDWAESWKKHFPVQRVGKRIVIKPSWRKYRTRRDEVVVELDPGMSFGTGQHATTQFCLKMIERLSTLHAPRHTLPPSLLDIGTGSGILAIAAAKLGYAPVLAVDNDPQAVKVARANMKANAGRHLRRATIRAASLDKLCMEKKYNVVAANLLADLILAQRRRLASLVAPGGFLILAGILTKEAPAVSRAFLALGFTTFACETKRNWAGFVFRKPNETPAHRR